MEGQLVCTMKYPYVYGENKYGQDEAMHDIYDCVDSFTSLLDTVYHLVFGGKGDRLHSIFHLTKRTVSI